MRSAVSLASRSRWLPLGLAVAILAAISIWQWRSNGPVSDLEIVIARDSQSININSETERKIISFCSGCHSMPVADSFSQEAWHHEVMQGYHFYAKSGRTDLVPPAPYLTISYFRSRAPKAVVLPEQIDDAPSDRIRFRPERHLHDKSTTIPPAIAHLKWLSPPAASAGQLISCDMRQGTVLGTNVDGTLTTHSVRMPFGFPCHAEPCDLNRDGRADLIVADLGGFEPDDHDRGRVVWLRGAPTGNWTVEPLAEKLGRVSDVRPVDLDLDGDLDFVVAEFGWHVTGGILVLRNQTQSKPGEKEPGLSFETERIYHRPGAIHVPCEDFDDDGLPDIVALVSQEHERIELLLNRREKPWTVQTLWAAPDPAFGLSGLELVDFDRDGDTDILFTNGDTFDSMTIKPSHGIQWLRNDGGLRFVYQRIADLSGVYRALAADFDTDGDLDLITSVWVAGSGGDAAPGTPFRPVVVLFEQVAPLKFERHTLQTGNPGFATLEVGDFDRDGDQDFAVSPHITRLDQCEDRLVIWWNESKPILSRSSP
jgi:hypothetical protein